MKKIIGISLCIFGTACAMLETLDDGLYSSWESCVLEDIQEENVRACLATYVEKITAWETKCSKTPLARYIDPKKKLAIKNDCQSELEKYCLYDLNPLLNLNHQHISTLLSKQTRHNNYDYRVALSALKKSYLDDKQKK